MNVSSFTETQIIAILKEAETGMLERMSVASAG